MNVDVLGPLVVDSGSVRVGPRDRVVLAALVCYRGEVLSAERLADALWGDAPPASWAKVVQGCVTRLRKLLGRDAIETVGHGYRLVLASELLDVARFEAGAARAGELLTLGEPDRAAFTAEQALSLWRGRPFVDLDGWGAAEIEAGRLEELRRDVEESRLEALLRSGRFREVLPRARALVSEGLVRERPWVLLARAQYQAGRQAEALATLRRARSVLSEGLGLDPGVDLTDLEAAILRQDPALSPQPSGEVSPLCPYQGLVPYDVGDADAFFGRDAEIAACLERLAATGMVAVVGPSGSGKSSLARAGVAAAVQREGRMVVVITPGSRPLDALTALPGRGPVPLLVVDQLEEALTLCDDGEERARFFDTLVEHAGRGGLVVALRADRLGDLAAYPGFVRRMEQSLYLLKAMDEADLRAAIEAPARQAGLLLEAGLVDLLIRDVEGEPGALPLLSHALRETWLAREGRTLTVAGYQAAGGIRGAVSKTAEQLYAAADQSQRSLLRDLLLRLVAPSPEGDPVRARVPRRMVATDDDHAHIIDLLVGARLVTADDGVIELAHESLARAWPRLQAWLDDDVDGQRILRHLAITADNWEAMGRPDSELYRGARLTKALEWRDRSQPDLTPTERAFLDTSQTQAEAEQQAARRRRRTLVGVLASATLVAIILGSVAVVQARQATSERDRALAAESQAEAEAERAEAEAERAEEAAVLARTRGLVSQGIVALGTDPALAKLLALAAADLVDEYTIEHISVLHRAFAADPVVARYAWPEGDQSVELETDLHPDGERMLAAGTAAVPSRRLELYDFARGETAGSWEIEGDELGIVESRFTPDGQHVVAGVMWTPKADSDEGALSAPDEVGVHIRAADDIDQLEQIIDVGRCGGWVGGVSDTHLSIVAIDAPACSVYEQGVWTALLVDRATGEQRELSSRASYKAPLSGDGRFVAFTQTDPLTVVVAEVASGERVAEIDPFDPEHGFVHADGRVYDVAALNHDGTLVVTGHFGRRVVVWDVASGQVVSTFAGHGGEGIGHSFSDDGASIYTSGRDGGVWQWDARRGDLIARFPAVGGGRISIAGPDRLLVSVLEPVGAALLDVGLRGEVWDVAACDGTIAWTLGIVEGYAAFSEFCDGGLQTFVVDLAEREVILTLPGQDGQHLAVSPDGTRLVRQDVEVVEPAEMVTPPRIRDLTTGELRVELEGVCTWDYPPSLAEGCVAFPDTPSPLWNWRLVWSPDSTLVATVRGGPAPPAGVMVWDATTGELLHRWAGCGATDAIFARDGNELILACIMGGSTHGEPRLLALSTRSWEEVRTAPLDPTLGARELDFAGYGPDGSSLVASVEADRGAQLHWIDPDTLQLLYSLPGIHDGAPKSNAMSPDGTLVAVGSSDGFVRVWDVIDRRLDHEIPLGDTQVQGLAFIDQDHLAVGTERGGLAVHTLDADELIELVRGSLTREFTSTECARFDLESDCPTAAAARSS